MAFGVSIEGELGGADTTELACIESPLAAQQLLGHTAASRFLIWRFCHVCIITLVACVFEFLCVYLTCARACKTRLA